MTAEQSPTIRIRPMTEADISSVAALEADIFSDAWSENLYAETLRGGRYYCRVLELCGQKDARGDCHGRTGNSLAGYFCGQIILDEAEVHRIAVSPELRGRGYGQVLLEDFLAQAKGAGATSVLLEVRAGNSPAIGLYEKNGFVKIGVRRGYYQKPKEDAWILQKTSC